MENEGIMALPEGAPMQPQAQSLPAVSSADTYSAALTALGQTSGDPRQADAVRQAVREGVAELDLSPEEMASLLEVLEYMSQNPEQYPQLRAQLIEAGMMDPEDLPEQYDPSVLGIAIMVLNEAMSAQSAGAAAPMQMAPQMEGMPSMPGGPMGFAQGGLASVAQHLASQGRFGDTMLAHITPEEARLLKARGGSGTINPVTGLPEFFLKKLFKKVGKAVKKVLKNPIFRVVATVALATVLGPAGLAVVGSKAAAAAIASGAVTAASGGKLKDVLVSAATGYFGAGGTVGGINPAASIATKLGGGAIAQGVGAGVTGAGLGLAAGMKPKEALTMGALQGLTAGGTEAFQKWLASRGAPATAPGSGMASRELVDPLAGVTDASQLPTPQAAPPLAPGAAPAAPAAVAGGAPSAAPGVGSAVPYNMPEVGVNLDPTTGAQSLNALRASNPAFNLSQAAPPSGSWFGRAGEFLSNPTMEGFKNTFLVNPNATSTLGRYAPAALTGLAVTGAMGGFKGSPAQEDPLFNSKYTGLDYIRDNPEKFKGGLEPTKLKPYNPMVETPAYGWQGSSASSPRSAPQPTMGSGQVPVYMPPGNAITNMPGGIPQYYNIPGLYQMPPVPGYAHGGDVHGGIMALNQGSRPTHFPRKTGPIDGPGTGTSDSIPAMLSDGEFVFTARAVRNAGGGSRRKGARRMYKLMKMLEGGKVEGK